MFIGCNGTRNLGLYSFKCLSLSDSGSQLPFFPAITGYQTWVACMSGICLNHQTPCCPPGEVQQFIFSSKISDLIMLETIAKYDILTKYKEVLINYGLGGPWISPNNSQKLLTHPICHPLPHIYL